MEPTKPQNQTTTTSFPVHASVGPEMSTEIPIPAHPEHHKKQKLDLKTLKEKFDSMPKNTRIMVTIVGVLFLILIILALLSALFGKKQTGVVVITPSPSPISVTPIPNVILNASRYATDSGVLKIESDLNGFQKQLDSSDVKQSDLSLPNIDYNINFNQ